MELFASCEPKSFMAGISMVSKFRCCRRKMIIEDLPRLAWCCRVEEKEVEVCACCSQIQIR